MRPVVYPVPATIVAAPAGAILQVPPADGSASVTDALTQTVAGPVMGSGSALTVTACSEGHPPPTAYDMVVTPPATPVTMPVVEILPSEGRLLDHVPPVVTSLSDIVLPTHTDDGPVMGDGPALTVIVRVTVQLVPPSE